MKQVLTRPQRGASPSSPIKEKSLPESCGHKINDYDDLSTPKSEYL